MPKPKRLIKPVAKIVIPDQSDEDVVRAIRMLPMHFAPPTPTARGTPAGIKLRDGFKTLVTISANVTVSFWEMTVKPPGIDGGDTIPQTTMHNTAWRTFAARQLKTLTPCTGKGQIDPNVINQLYTLINVYATITVTFPDLSTLAFFGYLRTIEFDEFVEGSPPQFSYEIQPTNSDHTNQFVEAAPVLTSVSGT